MRRVEAGWRSSWPGGRMGRWTSSPQQLGQSPRSVRAQSTQKVHSKEQIRASGESGGKSRSQHSQPGRISSILVSFRINARAHRLRVVTFGIATRLEAGPVEHFAEPGLPFARFAECLPKAKEELNRSGQTNPMAGG